MPLYVFHLEVPASPGVVAERIRAVVRKPPGFWESFRFSWQRASEPGPPFVGLVEGTSFRLRRNINNKNSFLPQVRGRIVATQNGARVDVVMFMHPLVLIFMLVWLGGVGYAAWGQRDAGTAPAFGALLMFVFGLALSVGGFFVEAMKVKPFLSAAVFDPTINAAPQTFAPQIDTSVLQREKPRGRFLLVAVAVGLLCFVALDQYSRHLRACPAFATSIALVSKSHEAIATLGEPIQAGRFVGGLVHQDSEAGYALLSIPLEGPKGTGKLYVVANRARDRWDLERVALWSEAGSKRIDLSPPTQAESFRYPARGAVYLLPLDNPAASYLRDLPSYFAARLGLDVTVMPVSTLGAETMDPATKQVIAEKALEFLVRANPEIASTLDAVALGVTSQDLNIKTAGWKFAINYRYGRFGIVSTARLGGMPWFAGHNPEVLGVRVRKMVTKNTVLLRYPVELSTDPTSIVAYGVFTPSEVDEMGETVVGEKGAWSPNPSEAPCVSITQGPGRRQSWRVGCTGDPPADSRLETFQNYTGIPLFVMARTDFALGDQTRLCFVRKYRPQDDRSRAFGIGATDSFDIFPVGDYQTFSWAELILADGGRVHFDRTSKGTGYADARFHARTYMGSFFSRSSLQWNGNGWDLATMDGWTYKFPSSGPDRSPQQSALLRIDTGSGRALSIERNSTADLQRVLAPDGSWIEFTCDSMHRVILAKGSSGRAVQYEYDAAGMLAHVRDSENGEEFYRYDPINRLAAVLDGTGRPLLVNTYGYMGEITSQTLADQRKLLYESGWDQDRRPTGLRLTDPEGYTIEWLRGRDGFRGSLPQPPRQE